jgi:hypothetical protein
MPLLASLSRLGLGVFLHFGGVEGPVVSDLRLSHSLTHLMYRILIPLTLLRDPLQLSGTPAWLTHGCKVSTLRGPLTTWPQFLSI